jgi:hypothetical protein
VGWLRDTDVAEDIAPDFLLIKANGRLHSSERLRRKASLVLSSYRGGRSTGLGMKSTGRGEQARTTIEDAIQLSKSNDELGVCRTCFV